MSSKTDMLRMRNVSLLLLAGSHQQLRNVTTLIKPLGKQRIQKIVSHSHPSQINMTEIWFQLLAAWPCDYPTHIRKQPHSTTVYHQFPVQYNKLLDRSNLECAASGCWTDWFDRDDPSGTGDWETLSNLRNQYPGKICPKPVDIEAQTLSGLSVAAAGDVIYK